MKYSDFITIRESKPAYNISNEEKGEWETFIPNAQFNEILRRVISAVRNNDQDAHKSFWIDGTYGTGKSHAAAVIKHLLCDNVEDIREYVDVEYAAHRFDLLRQSIYDLRQTKRLFPVNLYGPEGISRKEDFSHRLQGAIKKALKAAGITSFYVKTDFDDYANHVESEPAFWEDIIAQSPKLEAYTPDVKTLASKLRSADTSILTQVKEALAERRMDIRLDSANICDWFFEVQDKLAENTDFSGLLIIWDEFTDLMKSDIGPSLLVELQNITERAMETCNNSYFFFISHPSALNKLDAQERTKTTGRYHYMKYNMETVSAFKIMSRKFRIINKFNLFADTDEYKAIHKVNGRTHWWFRDIIETLLFGYYLKFNVEYLSEALIGISRIVSQYRYDFNRADYGRLLKQAGDSGIVFLIDRSTSPTFVLAELENKIKLLPAINTNMAPISLEFQRLIKGHLDCIKKEKIVINSFKHLL